MIKPNSETVIPNVQLIASDDDSELQIRLGAVDLRIELTMKEFVRLMQGKVINPKARFRPIIDNTKNFKGQSGTITLDADTLAMPTLDKNGRYLLAADRLSK